MPEHEKDSIEQLSLIVRYRGPGSYRIEHSRQAAVIVPTGGIANFGVVSRCAYRTHPLFAVLLGAPDTEVLDEAAMFGHSLVRLMLQLTITTVGGEVTLIKRNASFAAQLGRREQLLRFCAQAAVTKTMRQKRLQKKVMGPLNDLNLQVCATGLGGLDVHAELETR